MGGDLELDAVLLKSGTGSRLYSLVPGAMGLAKNDSMYERAKNGLGHSCEPFLEVIWNWHKLVSGVD